MQVLEGNGEVFTLPQACKKPNPRPTSRKLLEHVFQIKPRVRLHAPYTSIPLWQGKQKLAQRERAYAMHHTRNERIEKVRSRVNHRRGDVSDLSFTGLCPIGEQFTKCPMGLKWSILTGKK